MKSAVIRFPGSNCERDAFTVMEKVGLNPTMIWHEDTQLPDDLDLIVIPGGFTYGDYLRSGAMAAHAPIMTQVKQFADAGKHVLGICNGFQILCESRLLPGTLVTNDTLLFTCKPVHLHVENNTTDFTHQYDQAQVISIPVANHEGRYHADATTLQALNDNHQILFRYCDAEGTIGSENPNGSMDHIAGICNERGNVLGLMPHPERHADPLTGGEDGLAMFQSLAAKLN